MQNKISFMHSKSNNSTLASSLTSSPISSLASALNDLKYYSRIRIIIHDTVHIYGYYASRPVTIHPTGYYSSTGTIHPTGTIH